MKISNTLEPRNGKCLYQSEAKGNDLFTTSSELKRGMCVKFYGWSS